MLVSGIKLFALGPHPLRTTGVLGSRMGESFRIEAVLFVLQIATLAL